MSSYVVDWYATKECSQYNGQALSFCTITSSNIPQIKPGLNGTTSRVKFSGGTGAFAGFHADADVSVDAARVWHWDGTYSFTSDADDEDD